MTTKMTNMRAKTHAACCQRDPAHRAVRAPRAEGRLDIPPRLARGLRPRPDARTLRFVPGSSCGARLRRRQEPHHRAAFRGLPIRSDARPCQRARANPGRRAVHDRHTGDADRRRTVKTTPIVAYSCDPFVHVARLARPGGNVTGVTCMTSELMPKRLEILKELVPKAERVTFLQDPEAATNAFELTQEVAKRLGIKLQSAQVTAPEDLRQSLRPSQRTGLTDCWCIPTWFSAPIPGLSNSATSPSRPRYPRCMHSASMSTPAA